MTYVTGVVALHAYDGSMNANFDLSQRPLIVIWETTQACDLACFHCRACAQPKRNLLELTTEEARKLIRDVAALRPPIFNSYGRRSAEAFRHLPPGGVCGITEAAARDDA